MSFDDCRLAELTGEKCMLELEAARTAREARRRASDCVDAQPVETYISPFSFFFAPLMLVFALLISMWVCYFIFI